MRPEFKYGLAAGTGLCLWITVEYLLGLHTTRLAIGAWTGPLSNLILVVTLLLLLRRLQAQVPAGRLDLWSGVLAGLVTSVVTGAILYIFMQAYNRFINPGWMDNMLDWQVARFRADGMAETDIRGKIRFYRQMSSPLGCVFTLIGGTTLLGTVISAVFTLLLRRRQPA